MSLYDIALAAFLAAELAVSAGLLVFMLTDKDEEGKNR
jgi:hypothetical protein